MKRTTKAIGVTVALVGYLIAIALAVVVITRVPSSEANDICASQRDGTVFNNPASCRAFWECRNGVAVASYCQIGSNFHPTLLICQLQSNFPCTDPVETTTTEAPLDTTEFQCPPTGIAALPLPESCTSFRFCFLGTLTIRQCAPNTLFDRQILKCNRRSLVDCEAACPARSDPNVVIALPSRTHCDRFHICYNGNAIAYECASGLHWHTENQNCDLPENAKCVIS